ncbi:MAG: glycosyltransferase [Xenococcaceae cyanobacterium]
MNRPIAFFIPTMDGGGAERVVINLLKGMVTRDLPLDLLLANAEGPYLDLIPKQVRTIDLAAGRVIKAILPLVRYLRTARPKVIISHLGHANVIALVAKQLAGIDTKIIVVEHNTFSVAKSSLFRGHFIPPLMKWLYPQADAIVGVSQAVSRDLEQGLSLPTDAVKTIYNPVVDRELLAKKDDSVDRPWFQDQTIPVILAVGRFTEQKDFPTLLRAFALLRQKMTARLMILGEGELRPELETMVKQLDLTESVSLPGFVSNPYAYMSHASAFVLSSRWEGLPTALIEAMACGCPVVATDCPSGPKEILAEGRYGELAPVGDVEALSAALVRTLQNPPPRELFVDRAKDFETQNSVAEYLSLIEHICGSTKLNLSN